ncbi:GAF domain-containing protein [Dankookia rubra]|uniref:GAF domain-containing protein n=1 Tax=Dankookia rubra TaxID=1442381 RepID=A0A4R5QAT3_9PROT|nr:TIR domain-containing protein [Dankookia rubra]TDH59803.1 GAF domain-containing protein [Dankookia rubra]
MEHNNYDVFISYSHVDEDHAKELDYWLRSKGLKTFFDRRALRPGLPWVRAVEDAISRSNSVALLVGKQGIGSTQQYERELALVRQTEDKTFPVIPVLLPNSVSPPTGFLQLITWVDLSGGPNISAQNQGLSALLAAIRREDVESAAVRGSICPYMGLSSFREEDAAFFWGRKAAVDELVAKVRDYGLVAVVGRSGSGKSSLVYAGLLPALRRQRTVTWDVVALRPRATPLHALVQAFDPEIAQCGSTEAATRLETEVELLRTLVADTVMRLIAHKLANAPGQPNRLLIYVDEWDELYTATSSLESINARTQRAKDVDCFINLLLKMAAMENVRVVLTVRADSYGQLIRHPKLSRLLPFQQVNLGPMLREDLRAAIFMPATRAGLRFEPPSLVDQILDEVGTNEGMLPLLQYALKETWAHREGDTLTANGYIAAGRVVGAIQTTAQRIYDELSDDEKMAARRLFLGLVRPGEGREDTRARISMPEDSLMLAVVGKFAGRTARLLVTGSETATEIDRTVADRPLNVAPIWIRATVEVAHEALIRNWPTLREWLDDNRDNLRARAAILQQETEWIRQGRRPELLLPRGYQLERARTLLDRPGDVLVEDLREYITLSIERAQQYEQAEYEEKFRVAAMELAGEIERATGNLFRLDETLKNLCENVRKDLPFEFVAIQLNDKETKIIQTVYGVGLETNWYSIAKHSYRIEPDLNPALWDIQAHIAASDPPRAEIISGRDSRFDQFIYKAFKHENIERVFAPIILAREHEALEACRWNIISREPHVETATSFDRRVVLEISPGDLDRLKRTGNFEIIGTIEAGYRSRRNISQRDSEKLIELAGRYAPELRRASLENVFAIIARNAMRMLEADAASLHFLLDREEKQYIYEAWAGHRYSSITGPRPEGLGYQSLQARRTMVVPDREKNHDECHMRDFFPEAYAEGMQAEAAIPIFFSTGQSGLYSAHDRHHVDRGEKHGILYVRFNRPHWFTKGEIEWLEFFARRATQAIQQATYYTLYRENARRLVNLHSVAQSLADNSESGDILDAIAGSAMNAFAADIVTVYEYQAAKEKFEHELGIAGRFIAIEKTRWAPLEPDSSPYLVVKSGFSVYEENAPSNQKLCPPAASQNALQNRFVVREKITSAACVLLKTNQEIVGAMFVSYRRHHEFTPDERSLLEILASNAAVAIRNRRQLSRVGSGEISTLPTPQAASSSIFPER